MFLLLGVILSSLLESFGLMFLVRAPPGSRMSEPPGVFVDIIFPRPSMPAATVGSPSSAIGSAPSGTHASCMSSMWCFFEFVTLVVSVFSMGSFHGYCLWLDRGLLCVMPLAGFLRTTCRLSQPRSLPLWTTLTSFILLSSSLFMVRRSL